MEPRSDFRALPPPPSSQQPSPPSASASRRSLLVGIAAGALLASSVGVFLRLVPSTEREDTITINPLRLIEEVRLPIGVVRGVRQEIVGEEDASFGRVFRGIPFGKAGRFEEPVEADPVQVIDATKFRHSCMRPNGHWMEDMSEDCLHLNIFTPLHLAGEQSLRSPVAVWFHGGSYTMGAGSDTHREQVDKLVRTHRLVVVTINYRLGTFGFLGSDRMRYKDKSTGNFGTLDQQLALKWVKKHIGHFGGDPARISIFGWSAGGASGSVQLAVPGSEGLFSAAVMMSGGFTGWAAVSLEEADKTYAKMVKEVGCGHDPDCSAEGPACKCLVEVDARKLLAAQQSIGGMWGPTVDGSVLPYHPAEALELGKVHKGVPILIGTAVEDALNDIGEQATPAQFREYLPMILDDPSATDEAFDMYMDQTEIKDMEKRPSHAGISPAYWAARRAKSDKGMTCPARRSARQWREKTGADAYWYLWEEGSLPLFDVKAPRRLRSSSAEPAAEPETLAAGLKVGGCWPCPGATHGSDLPFLFETPSTEVDDSMANLAQYYHTFFANFVWQHDPNQWRAFTLSQHGSVAWPTIESGGMRFYHSNTTADARLRSRFCDFWDAQESKAKMQR